MTRDAKNCTRTSGENREKNGEKGRGLSPPSLFSFIFTRIAIFFGPFFTRSLYLNDSNRPSSLAWDEGFKLVKVMRYYRFRQHNFVACKVLTCIQKKKHTTRIDPCKQSPGRGVGGGGGGGKKERDPFVCYLLSSPSKRTMANQN